jgi:hypothetical protein
LQTELATKEEEVESLKVQPFFDSHLTLIRELLFQVLTFLYTFIYHFF